MDRLKKNLAKEFVDAEGNTLTILGEPDQEGNRKTVILRTDNGYHLNREGVVLDKHEQVVLGRDGKPLVGRPKTYEGTRAQRAEKQRQKDGRPPLTNEFLKQTVRDVKLTRTSG